MQQLDILASAAAKNDSGGVTNLNTTTAAPIDLTNTAGSIKERSREKVRPFISHFWAARCSEDTIDHRKEANNKRMANYWMVKELKESGINTLKELKEYMDWSDRALQEMQKESKRVGELNKTLEQNQKLRTQWEQAQREDKKDELYWKEKCLDNQAKLLEVQKKEVEALTVKIEKQLEERESSNHSIVREIIDNDSDLKKQKQESKEHTEELNALIVGYKQNIEQFKAVQDAYNRTEGFAAGIAAANKQHMEEKKQEQAEEQKAQVALERREALQKVASKHQKRKRQNWDADIHQDNIMHNTPKGSGSSSRRRSDVESYCAM